MKYTLLVAMQPSLQCVVLFEVDTVDCLVPLMSLIVFALLAFFFFSSHMDL